MKTIKCFLLLLLAVTFQHCDDPEPEPPIDDSNKGVPARWADITLKTIRATPPFSPTFTSRNLGYIGLTMYQSVVNGSGTQKSLVGQLSGLDFLPLPESGKEYNWTLSLNAGQALILKRLYAHTKPARLASIDSLELVVYINERETTDREIAERSAAYGRMVAEAIYEWSKTDGGHEGYLHNFDPTYRFPTGLSYWTPPTVGQSASLLPLHPFWGNNRTFVQANASLPVPAIVPYSTSSSSEYYNLFKEVYEKRSTLTDEEKRIAAWWADDPTQTASPPGHSYNLATIAVTSIQADIFTAAEVYAKVGMAVADAFICCWKCKYTYHSERPAPYIKRFIDAKYRHFWPEPPFPAFSSGHATQSAAAAIVLISVFGDDFALTDNTYQRRKADFEKIPYKPRAYANLWATAEECAYSRFLGGIHTRQDNEKGTAQGKLIGENIVALSWRK